MVQAQDNLRLREELGLDMAPRHKSGWDKKNGWQKLWLSAGEPSFRQPKIGMSMHLPIIYPSFIHHLSIIYPSFIHHLSIICPSFIHHLSIIYPSFVHHLSIIYPSFTITWADHRHVSGVFFGHRKPPWTGTLNPPKRRRSHPGCLRKAFSSLSWLMILGGYDIYNRIHMNIYIYIIFIHIIYIYINYTQYIYIYTYIYIGFEQCSDASRSSWLILYCFLNSWNHDPIDYRILLNIDATKTWKTIGE